MNADAIREFLKKRPFEALEVQLSSGQVYVIKHPECAIVLKNTLVIADPETDFVMWCSLIHVAGIRRRGEALPA
ncbi:MAG: hypothetical protein J2P46_17330 [Zavarzinella sp.]|nr:hypothetical protein [Zavarzinella sp.]